MNRLIVLLVLCLGLCGCQWLDGSYVSVTPHQIDYANTGDDTAQVSDFSQLRSALLDMINTCQTDGLFYLEGYASRDAQADMPAIIADILTNDPIGAYAVSDIAYTFGANGSHNAVSVTVAYRHSLAQIQQIRTVRDISGAEEAIAHALLSCDETLVLMVTGYEATDFSELIADYAALHPDVVMEIPQTEVRLYPDEGTSRVVELTFRYQTGRSSLRQMRQKVEPIFASAELYVTADADQLTRYSQLYSFLTERFEYQLQTSMTPAYSLLCHGVGDSRAFAQVYAAMCRQCGLECVTVSGSVNGKSRFWNIIRVDGAYRHVDLLQGQFIPRTDAEMTGYVWDYSGFPACE